MDKRAVIDWHIENDVFTVGASGRIYRVKRSARNRFGHTFYDCPATLADNLGSSNGYQRVTLSGGGDKFTVAAHRLVYEIIAGEPVPDGMVIHHVNGDRADNRFINLRVVTWDHNQDLSNWIIYFPDRDPAEMEMDAFWIKRALETGQSPTELANRFKVPLETVRLIEYGDIFPEV